jgi:hypothetical protein
MLAPPPTSLKRPEGKRLRLKTAAELMTLSSEEDLRWALPGLWA